MTKLFGNYKYVLLSFKEERNIDKWNWADTSWPFQGGTGYSDAILQRQPAWEKETNYVDFKFMKDIHLQFMKGKCRLDAKLIKLDQEKFKLNT